MQPPPPTSTQTIYVQKENPPNDGLITATYILSVCALLISPLFCGLPALVCALIAIGQNHPKGVQALVICILCSLAGLVFGMVLFASMM